MALYSVLWFSWPPRRTLRFTVCRPHRPRTPGGQLSLFRLQPGEPVEGEEKAVRCEATDGHPTRMGHPAQRAAVLPSHDDRKIRRPLPGQAGRRGRDYQDAATRRRGSRKGCVRSRAQHAVVRRCLRCACTLFVVRSVDYMYQNTSFFNASA